MTLDILICSLNKGIVRVQDVLLPPQEGVHYVISYQYTDERYLELIPQNLTTRSDVSLYKYKGQGLSANRNLALDKATGDIIMYADDDARLLPETPRIITQKFENDPQLQSVIDGVESAYGAELSDDELIQVSAAGELYRKKRTDGGGGGAT